MRFLFGAMVSTACAATVLGVWLTPHGPSIPKVTDDVAVLSRESIRNRVPQFFNGSDVRAVSNPEALPHDFVFTRAAYSGWNNRPGWRTDWPKADVQFLIGLRRLTNINAFDRDNAVRLDHPGIRWYPFLYAVEVGSMALTPAEIQGLRDYLTAGGFLVVDDFWGTFEWLQFESQMNQVLPGRPIVDIPLDHPIFSSFYHIEELVQVPNVGSGRRGGPTHESDGYVPHARGIFDDEGRLLVFINWNTDLGDAWEWAEDPTYPIRFSNFAYSMGINFIVYAMNH